MFTAIALKILLVVLACGLVASGGMLFLGWR
jgi:hypothetical protein